MRRRRTLAAMVLFCLALLAGFFAWSEVRDRGFLGGSHEPIDLLEQRATYQGNLALSSTALAERCRDTPRPDCDALISATCWDGLSGLTQFACLTTPAEGGWRRLPEAYDLPVRRFGVSATGDHLILDQSVADRDGNPLGIGVKGGQRWFRSGDMLVHTANGVMEITGLDGAVVETIDPPPPYLGSTSFDWRSWALSHDESMIVVMSGTVTSEVWLYNRDEQTWLQLQNDQQYVFFPLITGVGFSPDDQKVITARVAHDDDGSMPVRRWWIVEIDVDSGALTTLREANAESGISTSVSPDGRFVALANSLSETRILNLDTQEVSDRVVHCCHQPVPPSWSPEGSFLITEAGFVIEVIPDPIPLANGPFDLSPPDPHGAHLPLVRFQASST
jgi:hypothetical protein